ncbi:type II toxin-antitoxin system RelE/ParE family toxin [uncultured Brevundimonas sp.]|uniref:type II toxin-antitoxin system RelE/ParE family toxin n=1 Tax=uncultured Brevundimonas sp. TaxID=213418 RepID=UPI002620C841|nr:type II toxin-antitoxin system RelE/ParE family toxin [uncultured Brevundimonas sp.]
MSLNVVFSEAAERDLDELFYWIAENASPGVALEYTERLRDFCQSLSLFPLRARTRNILGLDVRIIGFERRTNIGYVVTASQVVIVSIDHGGRPSGRPDPQPSRSSE